MGAGTSCPVTRVAPAPSTGLRHPVFVDESVGRYVRKEK